MIACHLANPTLSYVSDGVVAVGHLCFNWKVSVQRWMSPVCPLLDAASEEDAK